MFCVLGVDEKVCVYPIAIEEGIPLSNLLKSNEVIIWGITLRDKSCYIIGENAWTMKGEKKSNVAIFKIWIFVFDKFQHHLF